MQGTFIQGMARLAAIFDRIGRDVTQEKVDREEIACERCGYWPCVCGDPDFEIELSNELNRAAEVD